MSGLETKTYSSNLLSVTVTVSRFTGSLFRDETIPRIVEHIICLTKGFKGMGFPFT